MPCYHPIPAWYSSDLTDRGKYKLAFRPAEGVNERRRVDVPCGTCIGCKLEFARRWAIRCLHESKCWTENHFVTLTYDGACTGDSLVPDDFVLFMKRLRSSQADKFGFDKVRFLQAGEYGTRFERPHHHALLFNCHIPDRVRVSSRGDAQSFFGSKYLEGLWGHGFVSIGTVTLASAGYVARYCVKKAERSPSWYQGRVREYMTMSRNPGIGRFWAEKYLKEWMTHDSVVVDGRESKPPRYYDELAKKVYPELYAEAKRKRMEASVASPDNTGRRLIARECVKKSAISLLSRSLEGD